MEKRDIYKAGACKFKNAEEKNFSLGCLFKAGLFDITNNKYRSWFVKFVDISDNPDDVLDYITDYDHLNLHYDRLCGKSIGSCKVCGRLFRQSKTKLANYCYKHRGYNKVLTQTIVCIDCGKTSKISQKLYETIDVPKAKKHIKLLVSKSIKLFKISVKSKGS